MRMSGSYVVAAVLLVLLGLVAPPPAGAAELTGGIDGFELAIQSGSHGAVFVFGVEGELNGRPRSGWGWIEVFHGPLPEAGGTAPILAGRGVIWIGFRRFRVDVLGGELFASASQPGLFEVLASIDLCTRRGGRTLHEFGGVLSHLTFPPTIDGWVRPSDLEEP